MCLSWSHETQNIASGGDDCQYRIWDSQGSLIYASFVEDHSITSVEFGPKGLYLAVGGFNMLKLCHFTGVIISVLYVYFESYVYNEKYWISVGIQ